MSPRRYTLTLTFDASRPLTDAERDAIEHACAVQVEDPAGLDGSKRAEYETMNVTTNVTTHPGGSISRDAGKCPTCRDHLSSCRCWYCPTCDVENVDDYDECTECGADRYACPVCGEEPDPDTQSCTCWYCPTCKTTNPEHLDACTTCTNPQPGAPA
jgi:hypothetical protein